MIAILRTNNPTKLHQPTEDHPPLQIPDLEFLPNVEVTASETDQGHSILEFEHTNGRRATMLLHGPHTIPNMPGTYYIVDAPKRILLRLRLQLGDNNVRQFMRALRLSKPLRLWARQQGFTVHRNQAKQPIAVLPPLVIAGSSPIDLDGEDPEEATPLPDLDE